MQHFERILPNELMCTTCCTTRSLNRPFVSHPCSRVTVFLNYLLCYTTIVSCRVELWLFSRHPWRNYIIQPVELRVGWGKIISKSPMWLQEVDLWSLVGSCLVGSRLMTTCSLWGRWQRNWFGWHFCGLLLHFVPWHLLPVRSAFPSKFGKWAHRVTSWSLDRLDKLVRSEFSSNGTPATDATTSLAASLQQ